MHAMGRPRMEWPRETTRRDMATPTPALVLLVIVLAVAAISVGPAATGMCAALEEFPCGP